MDARTKGIVSIISGIISLVFFSFPWLLIILGGLAIYFGFKAKREEQKKSGITGMILGSISLFVTSSQPQRAKRPISFIASRGASVDFRRNHKPAKITIPDAIAKIPFVP
ncbi:MAG: hypothetical protein KJ718_05260, partial [Nanoarchaeota archaeon]|nr:hypothetical protein [Nanoarchaeota archaeon]